MKGEPPPHPNGRLVFFAGKKQRNVLKAGPEYLNVAVFFGLQEAGWEGGRWWRGFGKLLEVVGHVAFGCSEACRGPLPTPRGWLARLPVWKCQSG